jgi:nucleotide-binding universal stress UspA family protein
MVLNDVAEASANRVGYRRILHCTDLSRDSTLGVRHAASLTTLLEAELHVIHAFSPPARIQLVDALDTQAGGRPWHFIALHLEFVARCDRDGSPMDLITVATHGKGAVAERFMGSTTDVLIRRAAVPVLVSPRAWLNALASEG